MKHVFYFFKPLFLYTTPVQGFLYPIFFFLIFLVKSHNVRSHLIVTNRKLVSIKFHLKKDTHENMQ